MLGTASLPDDGLNVSIGAGLTRDDVFLIRAGSEKNALFVERVGTTLGGLIALIASVVGGSLGSTGRPSPATRSSGQASASSLPQCLR